MERASGILMHITSLPNKEGIGTFGESAYQFVDFLNQANQSYWQVLPLGPVGYGNSPYQAFSAFAGNPYLIDLASLQKEGLLPIEEDILLDKKEEALEKVDFECITAGKLKLLYKAYRESKTNKVLQETIHNFVRENKEWLEDYSLFMAIKESQGNVAWQYWPKVLRDRQESALKQVKQKLKEQIDYWNFIQYEFHKQWFQLKHYMNQSGIKVIGDIPIYIASDSSDAWAHPELFKLDTQGVPIAVAGCPPDVFTADGQLWGNPIYDWCHLKEQDYSWWVQRMSHNAKLYDVIRIDHFRGFESFWEVPGNETTARNGQWVKGPGYSLFKTINEKLGELHIIAEDLGFITEEVIELRKKTGYPGMTILQFAFNPQENSSYLPHNCDKDTVSYIGTHDNETIMGWIKNPINKNNFLFARRYLRLNQKETYHWGFIRGLWATPSVLAVVQMQDVLGLGNEARMNIPSTLGDNWTWRMKPDAIDQSIIKKLKKLTKLYGRMGRHDR